MSGDGSEQDDSKRVVAMFVERRQNQHDLAFADEIFHLEFVNHYRPEVLPPDEQTAPPALAG